MIQSRNLKDKLYRDDLIFGLINPLILDPNLSIYILYESLKQQPHYELPKMIIL